MKSLQDPTLYKQRYSRKGLYDALPQSADEYEKSLAVCADDVLFLGFQTMHLRSCLLAGKYKSMVATILAELERDLMLLSMRRRFMTKLDADRHDFKEAVTKTLAHYTGQICKDRELALDFQIIYHLKLLLKEHISPWLCFDVFIHLSKPWVWVFAEPGQVCQKPHSTLETLHMSMDVWRVLDLDKKLESTRLTILKGGDIERDDLEFARCFRKFLETGKEEHLPFLAVGTLRKREYTLNEYFDNVALKCQPGCDCSMDTMKASKRKLVEFRKSNAPTATRERREIATWFSSMDKKYPEACNPFQTKRSTKRYRRQAAFSSSSVSQKLAPIPSSSTPSSSTSIGPVSGGISKTGNHFASSMSKGPIIRTTRTTKEETKTLPDAPSAFNVPKARTRSQLKSQSAEPSKVSTAILPPTSQLPANSKAAPVVLTTTQSQIKLESTPSLAPNPPATQRQFSQQRKGNFFCCFSNNGRVSPVLAARPVTRE